MQSLGEVMDRHRGIGPGFDVLRLLLSILVLCWHSVLVSYGGDDALWLDPRSTPASALLPMFFALSGFLVMGSALRVRELRSFITLRALRIAPALATEISLSAILFGAAFTTLHWKDYFLNNEFFAYFGSLIGRVRVTLPGVFETNPYPNVANISLWTISPELLCYVFLAVLMLTRAFANKIALVVVVGVLTMSFLWWDAAIGVEWLGVRPAPQFLVLSFAYGNLIYAFRNEIPFNSLLFAACAVIGFTCVRVFGLVYLALLCLSYCIVWLGLIALPKIPILSKGDYSYGIYLYAFPIQQMVGHILPGLREWYWNILIALPLTIAMAMVSWTFVEKPTLALRKRFAAGKKSQPLEHGYFSTGILLFLLMTYAYYLALQAHLFHLGSQTMRYNVFWVAAFFVASAITSAVMFARARRQVDAQMMAK